MRKIKGFKLTLRAKEVARRVKKARIDLAGLGLDEISLQRLIDRATQAFVPSVLFDTFAHPDLDQSQLSPIPGLAYSLILVTLGPQFDELKMASIAQEPTQELIWPIIAQAALDESIHFATTLIQDEAAQDGCELSPITQLSTADALSSALRKLDGSKIGIVLGEIGLAPSASAACSLSWLSKAKVRGKAKS